MNMFVLLKMGKDFYHIWKTLPQFLNISATLGHAGHAYFISAPTQFQLTRMELGIQFKKNINKIKLYTIAYRNAEYSYPVCEVWAQKINI